MADEDLGGILENYSKANKSGGAIKAQAVKGEDEWVEKFNALRKNVIRPMMEQLGVSVSPSTTPLGDPVFG